MISWHCAVCEKQVKSIWNKGLLQWEPESHYWKGSPTEFNRVYCSPTCSLKDFEDIKGE